MEYSSNTKRYLFYEFPNYWLFVTSKYLSLSYVVSEIYDSNNFFALLVFKAEPPTPSSAAQEKANEISEEERDSFLLSVKKLAVNPAYILLVVSYGINVGIYYAISTLLNQIIVKYYPVSSFITQ